MVCDDLVTYEGATDYYVYDNAEAYCQVTKTAQVVPCKYIQEQTTLETGGGATASYKITCGLGGPSCPAGRLNKSTRNWDYSIAHAGGGTCSSNTDSSYQVYGIVWGEDNFTMIETPTGDAAYYLQDGEANDGVNESSGHYFVCP